MLLYKQLLLMTFGTTLVLYYNLRYVSFEIGNKRKGTGQNYKACVQVRLVLIHLQDSKQTKAITLCLIEMWMMEQGYCYCIKWPPH